MLENMISELLVLSFLGLASVSANNVEGHGKRCIPMEIDTVKVLTHGYKDEDYFCWEVRASNIFGFLFHTLDGLSFSDDSQEIITYDTTTGNEKDGISTDCLIAQFDKGCKFEPTDLPDRKCSDVSVKTGGLSKIYVARKKPRESGHLQNVSVTVRAIDQYQVYFNFSNCSSTSANVTILTRKTPSQTSSPQTEFDMSTSIYSEGTSNKTMRTGTAFDSTKSYSEKTTSACRCDYLPYQIGLFGLVTVEIIGVIVWAVCRTRSRKVSGHSRARNKNGKGMDNFGTK